MKAIAYEESGSPDILELRKVDKPSLEDGEELVRVCASSPNPWDWHFMRGFPYISWPQAGWRKPKNAVLGSDRQGSSKPSGRT